MRFQAGALATLGLLAVMTHAPSAWKPPASDQAAEVEKREVGQAFENAKGSLKDAGGRVVREEAALRKALMEDSSRREAWDALFAIFTIINFAGPYAISRVLGKWRNERTSAKAEAEAGYHACEGAKLLRGSRDAQKTGAMRLFAAAIERLSRDGIASDVLNQINGAEVAAGAAERFDRSVNPGKYQPRTRFFGLNRS